MKASRLASKPLRLGALVLVVCLLSTTIMVVIMRKMVKFTPKGNAHYSNETPSTTFIPFITFTALTLLLTQIS